MAESIKKPFYVLWAYYYNYLTGTYQEKMLGCYRSKERAEKMTEVLNKKEERSFYKVQEEYFCDD